MILVCFLGFVWDLWLTFNDRCGITGPEITHDDNVLPVAPNIQPPGLTTAPDSGELLASPPQGGSGGWVGRTVRKALRKLKVIT